MWPSVVVVHAPLVENDPGHRPAPRDLFNAGATLGVEQPAALLEHLTEVARHDPEIIGLGVKDDE
jgi:hypothetical protein